MAWRPLLRELVTYVLVGAVVAASLLVVWWTRHPESDSLTAARGWPLVGPLASRLQDRYLPELMGPGDGLPPVTI